MFPRYTRSRTPILRSTHSRSRFQRVFPAGEGFNDHVASSPIPRRFVSSAFSRAVYLSRQRGHFYSAALQITVSHRHSRGSAFSPFSLLPLLPLITFGRAERIHYASVRFADFLNRDMEGNRGEIVQRTVGGEGTNSREGGYSRKRKT